MKKLLIIVLVMVGMKVAAQPYKTQNVIIITLDGFRWQEVFTGADSILLNNKNLVKNTDDYKNKYWNSNPAVRREMLMPFLWESIAKNGQIYGNRHIGCNVNVANPYWFSYPGYSEILCGFADKRINSNSYGPNPNINVLEFINQTQEFNGKVAAFSSWAAFPDILNKTRSGLPVNSAFDKVPESESNPQIDMLNKMQTQLPDVFYGVRLDALTFNIGFEYLKTKRPRVLYLAFDETDDFAHEGKYDYYLNSANYTDSFIKELWHWIQSDEDYRDKTTLLITVDHGRGVGEPGWRNHGRALLGHSSETWFAVIGPDTPAIGEVSGGQYYNAQYAQTLASLLGVKYVNEKPLGVIISKVTENKSLISQVNIEK